MIIALQTLVFFRKSILTVLDRLLRPYYKNFSLSFSKSGDVSEDEESEEQVFADYDDDKGVVFYPPMYAQRYAAVSDCLMDERWCGKLEKVVDLGYHDMSFIKYLKEVPGVQNILGVDIESIPLRCSSDLLSCEEYAPKREHPLQVTLFQGNAADPDFRLIGCDAVIAIEMIEHMLPHDLDRLVHTVFGFIKPHIAIFTTPNGDFNVLFKSLEKNGLRRLDHFFEWSKVQFNDWCSNIVVRYPQYTVSYKGIGPGPPDTLHIGCCSQLALFIAKDYHKQENLTLNSLALVQKVPSPNTLSDVLGGWDSPTPCPENNMLCSRSKLNCTTLQVTKFSKTTQNLMAKNKIDSLVHTREVVDEIRHLTKMLNFNKDNLNQHEAEVNVWCNINWGENAPYWNQYYKIVREYNYPFETKSEQCRILDLISDEINRLIDLQYDEEFSVDVNKLEIPIYHLMRVVKHITEDVEMVKELLDWNGYEVVDDVVIHSRVVLDSGSMMTHDEEWPDNDTYSDWDNTTEIHSTSVSDGSTILPDINGRCLRRALDHKVRKLRTMLTADEDITTELDRVVCRLMKLALRTSKGRQTPPPTRWMQCKLLDLLTLTEKAIDRRKRHFIEKYPLKAISYDEQKAERDDLLALKNIHSDDTVRKIVDKYQHFVNAPDNANEMKSPRNKYRFIDLELEDDLSVTSTEFLKDYEYIETAKTPSPLLELLKEPIELANKDEDKLERIQAWVDDDLEVVPYPNHDNSSGDTDHSVSNGARYRFKRFSKRHKVSSDKTEDVMSKLSKRSKSRILYDKFNKLKQDEKNKTKTSNTKITKKATRRKPSAYNLFKNSSNKLISVEYGYYGVKYKKKKKKHDHEKPTASNPIPGNLIHLCHSKFLEDKKIVDEFYSTLSDDNKEVIEIINNQPSLISATENSCMITIVMEGLEETIALRRTIGTDADDPMIENERVIGSISAVKDDGFCRPDTPPENVQSQTIFLNDINEPSTSKGIRHTSMDVQCGPDTTVTAFAALTAPTSLSKIPNMFTTTGIKIGDSNTDLGVKQYELGTSTNDYDNVYKTITPRIRSVGICIKDSDVNISRKVECSTMTKQDNIELQPPIFITQNVVSGTETKLLKPFTSNLEFEESCSELFESNEGSQKSPLHFESASKNTSDVLIECSGVKDMGVMEKITAKKYVRPKLCCGGIHIHSYKDKQVSEDVIYQGEWQRHKSKLCVKKKVYNPVVAKKVTDACIKKLKASSKERVSTKNTEKAARTQLKSSLQARDPTTSAQNKVKGAPSSTPKFRSNRNITKVASKITIGPISSKITKSSFAAKKATMSASVSLKKENDNPQKPPKYIRQSYLPAYLKKRTLPPTNNKNYLNQSIGSVSVKVNKEKQTPPFVRSKTDDINKDLLKLRNIPPNNINYAVFRNELEKKKSGNENEVSKDPTRKRYGSAKRSQSPQSQNSSTCSSPSSIATVRAVSTRPKITTNRRHSSTSNKNSLTNSESENTTPNRNKKFTKRQKTVKKTDEKACDNKENIPQSSDKLSLNKTSDKLGGKGVFMGRHKNIFMAQLSTDSSHIQSTLNNSKHKAQLPNKSNVKIPTVESTDEKILMSQSESKKETFIPDTSSRDDSIAGNSENSSVLSNMVLVLEPQDSKLPMSETPINTISVVEINAVIENNILTQWVNSSNNIVSGSHTSNVIDTMRQLVEETLDFIDALDCYESIDSETVILSRDDNKTSSLDVSLSPSSYKANEENDMSTLLSEIEATFNRTFESPSGELQARLTNYTDTRLSGNDDNLSFQSANSESKLSEYFTFESDLENRKASIKAITPVSGSVQDIYERKDQCPLPNPHGALAIQAFSGFSINGEPVSGDQPDHVNLVDSETGSLAVGVARQTTSEELIISGRSSGSYESCVLDEDAVVPSWLFRIISQQQAVEEETEASEVLVPLPIAMPLQEPMFDVNGNVLDAGVGVGAGAGDGRGIHSDHSQDSSGRGTSLSSSDMSPGPQSEAILIDPSAFTAQFELLRESIGSTVRVATGNDAVEPTENTFRVEGIGMDSEAMSSNREESTRSRRNAQAAASDADADVSSLDTDVPDSSDN